ncbi:MAG: hypothetical protein ACXVPQ_12565 [Bacteroidia bacterium]
MMFSFTVHRPSTFFSDSPNVMILDDHKFPFYFHDNKERHINFNLPSGKYYSRVPIKKMPKFVPYNHGRYPRFTDDFLNRVQVYPHPNPNKASISLKRAFILADPKFYYHDYKPLKTFTLCHEVFHRFFHCKHDWQRQNRFIHQFYEKQCDNAAKNWMLAHGWNPTQVSLAAKLLLRGKERRQCISDNATHPRNKNRR